MQEWQPINPPECTHKLPKEEVNLILLFLLYYIEMGFWGFGVLDQE